MTIAGKINALVLSIAVAAGCILTLNALQREYSVTRKLLIRQSYHAVQGQPQLQVAIYLNDQAELQATLRDFLQSSPTIRYAIVRNPACYVSAEHCAQEYKCKCDREYHCNLWEYFQHYLGAADAELYIANDMHTGRVTRISQSGTEFFTTDVLL